MSGEGRLQVERGLSPDTLALLESRGHVISSGQTLGSTQMLLIGQDRVEGAADPRRPGAAPVAE
jgi:gamma-glutamyltranspeptidase/glutathione hydrolase